ncbi:D-alanine--D-alanine ligase [Myxococcota bacterium]|nr:D-alanine--D-alanine ligase [Myxococcota bacterium]
MRVGLIFGGRSVEHEVSIASATSVLKALDPARYEVMPIRVENDGRWFVTSPGPPDQIGGVGEVIQPQAIPGEGLVSCGDQGAGTKRLEIDVVFSVIHGRGGEDGALQGLFELAELPYVGSGVLGSAIQMDKEVAKRLLHAAGLPVTPWVSLSASEIHDARTRQRILDNLPFPIFVKPANSGSSVGISRVDEQDGLISALNDAARYDTKLLVEQGIDARELEVAILGNGPYEASVVGEILTEHAFYDYEAKYIEESTNLVVPATLSQRQADALREMATDAAGVLEGAGLARVDFLLERNGDGCYINEINSIPGFTESSMYPRLWEASGLAYPALLDRIIELAFDRHAARSNLETLYRRGS